MRSNFGGRDYLGCKFHLQISRVGASVNQYCQNNQLMLINIMYFSYLLYLQLQHSSALQLLGKPAGPGQNIGPRWTKYSVRYKSIKAITYFRTIPITEYFSIFKSYCCNMLDFKLCAFLRPPVNFFLILFYHGEIYITLLQ